MATRATFDWATYIEKALIDLDDIPLMGNVPELDEKDLERKLQEALKIQGLKLRFHKWQWYTSEHLEENMGSDSTVLNFSLLPLQGRVSFVLSAMDLNSLITWITEKKSGRAGVINSHFIQGLLTYVSVEVLHLLEKQPPFDGFLMRYHSDSQLPAKRSLGLDVEFEAYGESLTGRLLVPETFRKNWKTHFLEKPKELPQASLHKEISCALKAGDFYCSLKDWKSVQVGDFLPVENCQVSPESRTGSLELTVGGCTLFRLRLKEKGLKILDQPLYQEENMSEGDMENEFDGLGPDEDIDSEPQEDMEDNPAEVGDNMEMATSAAQTLDKIEDVPLHMTVELARFKMTCGKLLHLKPGNILELNIHPEKPVHLVSGGKKVAEGELVQIGEVLGVRILNI